MEELLLKAEVREQTGSKDAARVRKQGRIPANWKAKPAKLRRPRVQPELIACLRSHFGDGGYTLFSPWSRDPARSLGKPFYDCVDAIVDEFGPLVILRALIILFHLGGIM